MPLGTVPATGCFPCQKLVFSEKQKNATQLNHMSPQREKKIERLIQLFESHKVLVDEARVEKVLFSPVNGDGQNQVIRLSWWREKSKEIGVIITEDGLAYATVLSTSLDIEDHEGDPVNIVFLDDNEKPVKLS